MSLCWVRDYKKKKEYVTVGLGLIFYWDPFSEKALYERKVESVSIFSPSPSAAVVPFPTIIIKVTRLTTDLSLSLYTFCAGDPKSSTFFIFPPVQGNQPCKIRFFRGEFVAALRRLHGDLGHTRLQKQVEPVRFGGDVPGVPHEQSNRLVCRGEEGLVGVAEHAVVVQYDDLFFDGAQLDCFGDGSGDAGFASGGGVVTAAEEEGFVAWWL
ncbi:hypothetical protein M0R45_034396 [Rubus argutus]|uniref:Uncharacterized protein n=1 Tax=Rubus argutus TaxID=59490 RepID=A0AAW1VVG0_RUBAR